MRLKFSRIVIVAAAAIAPLAAVATPPWYVDWAHTVEFQRFAIRAFYLSNENGTSRSQSIPRIQIAYGATKNFEVNIRNEDLL